jgi:hypothetical protein
MKSWAEATGHKISDNFFFTKEQLEDIIKMNPNPTGMQATSKASDRGVSNLMCLPWTPREIEERVLMEHAREEASRLTCREQVTKIIKLRRRLALQDPSCYEQGFSDLARSFKDRLRGVKGHLHLHIPKAGGSSLCWLVKKLHKKTTNSSYNCWEPNYFYPAWFWGNFTGRQGLLENATCDDFAYPENQSLPEFVMNENYLDHPLCLTQRIYSMTLRNPIDRAMSNDRHLLYIFNGPSSVTRFHERRELVRHNYITWALSAGTNNGSKFSLVPHATQLEIAKDTISSLDFLIDFSQPSECLKVTLELMSFGNRTVVSEANVGKGNIFKKHLPVREKYEQWNVLDFELYEYAQQLMMVDCIFFLRLLETD